MATVSRFVQAVLLASAALAPAGAWAQEGTTSTDPEDAQAAEDEETSRSPLFGEDPLGPMARAAGYTDAERWWDHLVESRAGELNGWQGHG